MTRPDAPTTSKYQVRFMSRISPGRTHPDKSRGLSLSLRACFQHCFWGSPFMNARTSDISYRGEKGKTTGYYVPKGAEEATREGVAAWQKLQECLRELAELNKDRNLGHAREAESRRSDG